MEIINIDKPNSLNTEAENVSCETEANANQNCIDQEDGSTAATTNAVDTEIQSIEESHDVGGADSIDKVEKGNEENNDFSNDTTSNECVSVQSDDSESKSELEQVLDGEWKKMIVYDQFTRTRNTGKIIYKGEDAFPYVGNDLFFVADGLGGTGASTHTKFDKNLFEEDQVVSTLFDGIFADITDEQFCNYVKKSFMELISIKDCYYDNRMNWKHSAYFGSRLVSAIILQMMKEHENIFAPRQLFAKLEQPEKRAELIHNIEVFVAEYIKSNLMKITEKVGLEHESAPAKQNFKLMATSLCATIYLEKDDCIELLYMNAGDSRAFMWDETGLHQVVEDQESADGGMTNFIFAEPDGKFTIECKYLNIKKPCVLFNATDGCFDAFPFMISPLAFEKYILETICSSNSLAEAGDIMGKFFMSDENRNDDSSTMAFKVFGYESLEQLKAAFKARLEKINADYMDGFGDLLSCDFTRQYNMLESNSDKKIKELKQRCLEDESIIAHCVEKVKAEPSAEYSASIQDIDKADQICDKEIKTVESSVLDIFVRNFDSWITYLNLDIHGLNQFVTEQLHEKKKRIFGQIEVFQNEIYEQSLKAKVLFDQINDILSHLGQSEGVDLNAFEMLKIVKRELQDILGFIESSSLNKHKSIRQINAEKEEYFRQNVKLAKHIEGLNYREIIYSILEKANLDDASLFDEDKNKLKSVIDTYNAQLKTKKELEEQAQLITQQEAKKYCDTNSMAVIQYAATSLEMVNDELKAALKDFWHYYETERNDILCKASKQQSLCQKYSTEYFKFIECEE